MLRDHPARPPARGNVPPGTPRSSAARPLNANPLDRITGKVILKLERQAILHDRSKRFEFLLTESALRWQLCESSVMARQLDRLVPLSWLPNIRIGVLPLSARVGDGPYHTFVIYDDHLCHYRVVRAAR